MEDTLSIKIIIGLIQVSIFFIFDMTKEIIQKLNGQV